MRRAIVLVAVGLIGGGVLATGPPVAEEATATRAEVSRGEELFSAICSHCHGPHMVNPGTVSFDLRKFPHDDEARFLNSVRNGKNSMPPWKDVLQPDEIEALWAYVRTGGGAP
jgi:mono/diheme cytochrome c family protein